MEFNYLDILNDSGSRIMITYSLDLSPEQMFDAADIRYESYQTVARVVDTIHSDAFCGSCAHGQELSTRPGVPGKNYGTHFSHRNSCRLPCGATPGSGKIPLADIPCG